MMLCFLQLLDTLPQRREHAHCRNWHYTLPVFFTSDLCWAERKPGSLLFDLTCCSECLFVHSYQWISFTENNQVLSTAVRQQELFICFQTCGGLNISSSQTSLVRMGHEWNETTVARCFWCITWVWTDETACTSILKTPLCPSTHLIGGVCDGTFYGRKEWQESLYFNNLTESLFTCVSKILMLFTLL